MQYAATGGTVTFDFDRAVLEELHLRFIARGQADEVFTGSRAVFNIQADSTLVVGARDGTLSGLLTGQLRTRGALLIDKPHGRDVIGNLTIVAEDDGTFSIDSTLDAEQVSLIAFVMESVLVDFSSPEKSLRLIGEISISPAWARVLRTPEATGVAVGTVVVDARMLPLVDATRAPDVVADAYTSGGTVRLDAAGVPDIIVADLQSILRYDDDIPGITSFAIATTACNIGTKRASWISNTNQHPVIVQNVYRLRNDRFEQIGLSWVKHGFYAVSQSLCSPCLDPTDGTQLGVGCSDPYSAVLNGVQTNMSPRTTVNANTGEFPYPWDEYPPVTPIDRRVQIRDADLDPALNRRARYFIQGHYISPGDTLARTHNNNASYREVEVVELGPGEFTLETNSAWPTRAKQPALRAWHDVDPSVDEIDIQIPNEGLFILAAKVIDLGSGIWRYEYALQNLNSDRSAMSFSVPIPPGVAVTNIGFHDIAYHSGEPVDSTDWVGVALNGAVTWSTQTYDANPNANALRWGTVYNFRFDVNAWNERGLVTIGLFKPPQSPGDPLEITGESLAPTHALIDCNGNKIMDACDISCDALDCTAPCGMSGDCDGNAVPDECQPDCDGDGSADACDILSGVSADCDGNGVPDECEPDCNLNQISDWCDIRFGPSEDCNWNDVPDECEIDENSEAPGGPFFCTALCDPDCNVNGKPDACDIDTDDDNDRVFGCDDLCPFTNPGLKCGCNLTEDCCFPGWCYSDFLLPPISPIECRNQGGEPQCDLSPLCRNGCLIGDVDRSGIIDLKDVAGMQACFGTLPGRLTDVECLRIYDFDEDGLIDLTDYITLWDLLLHGVPP
ncbi:MAG: hypothetical protein ACE5HE_02275 [Phycisphaerae bacterium]